MSIDIDLSAYINPLSAMELDIDLGELFISTKTKDLTDPIEVIKQIKQILNAVVTDHIR